MSRVSRAVTSVVALGVRTKIRTLCFQLRYLAANCVMGDNSGKGIETLGHHGVCVSPYCLLVCTRSGGVASIATISVAHT